MWLSADDKKIQKLSQHDFLVKNRTIIISENSSVTDKKHRIANLHNMPTWHLNKRHILIVHYQKHNILV